MKKYIYILLLSLPLFFASCLKEDGVFEDNGSYGIVELSLSARNTSTPYAIKSTTIEVEDEAELLVKINYTGVNGAPEDVRVTLAIDDAAIAKQYPTGATIALPAGYYELPASNVVTIPKGGKTATYTIKIKPRLFDLTKLYALGVKIVSATAGTVSGNYSTGVYLLPVKSPWEGVYTVTYRWHAGGGFGTADETYTETDVQLKTVGPGVVEASGVAAWFSGNTRYTFYPDATVGVEAYSGANLATGVLESSADTENFSTFHIRYWFANTGYEIEETYVKTGN
jgi:hypothetical protein